MKIPEWFPGGSPADRLVRPERRLDPRRPLRARPARPEASRREDAAEVPGVPPGRRLEPRRHPRVVLLRFRRRAPGDPAGQARPAQPRHLPRPVGVPGCPQPRGHRLGLWRAAVSLAKGKNEDMAPNHHGWSKPVAGWGPATPAAAMLTAWSSQVGGITVMPLTPAPGSPSAASRGRLALPDGSRRSRPGLRVPSTTRASTRGSPSGHAVAAKQLSSCRSPGPVDRGKASAPPSRPTWTCRPRGRARRSTRRGSAAAERSSDTSAPPSVRSATCSPRRRRHRGGAELLGQRQDVGSGSTARTRASSATATITANSPIPPHPGRPTDSPGPPERRERPPGRRWEPQRGSPPPRAAPRRAPGPG